MNHDSRAVLWPLLLIATVFTLSGTSQIATPDLGFDFSKDKLAHFLVFGLLATSILRIPRIRKLGWLGAFVAALITITYGGLDEFRQSFTPGRLVEFDDWLADTLGAIVAVVVYQLDTPYRRILEWNVAKRAKKALREKDSIDTTESS